MTETQRSNEMEFSASIEEMFDIAHKDAMTMMVIEEDKQFLHFQRQGKNGYIGRIGKELAEENSENKKEEKQKREES